MAVELILFYFSTSLKVKRGWFFSASNREKENAAVMYSAIRRKIYFAPFLTWFFSPLFPPISPLNFFMNSFLCHFFFSRFLKADDLMHDYSMLFPWIYFFPFRLLFSRLFFQFFTISFSFMFLLTKKKK